MIEPIKLIVATDEFFSTPPKKLRVEENRGVDRTYFLKGDRIVAVGTCPTEPATYGEDR